MIETSMLAASLTAILAPAIASGGAKFLESAAEKLGSTAGESVAGLLATAWKRLKQYANKPEHDALRTVTENLQKAEPQGANEQQLKTLLVQMLTEHQELKMHIEPLVLRMQDQLNKGRPLSDANQQDLVQIAKNIVNLSGGVNTLHLS